MTKQATKFDEKNSDDVRHGCDSIPISNSDIFRVPEFSLAHIMAVRVRKPIILNIHNYIYMNFFSEFRDDILVVRCAWQSHASTKETHNLAPAWVDSEDKRNRWSDQQLHRTPIKPQIKQWKNGHGLLWWSSCVATLKLFCRFNWVKSTMRTNNCISSEIVSNVISGDYSLIYFVMNMLCDCVCASVPPREFSYGDRRVCAIMKHKCENNQ